MAGSQVNPFSTWTCIAVCGTCGVEGNRATGVPDNQKAGVAVSAPLQARCDVQEHDTRSDFNLNYRLEWTLE